MSTTSFYTRQMLTTYGRQLVNARRLVRYEQLMGRQLPPEDAVAYRRKLMIERISKEIVDNLIFSGSQNSIVVEVRKALESATGMTLEFYYPPGRLDYQIFKLERNGDRTELSAEEKQYIMNKLWDVTTRTVDATTL